MKESVQVFFLNVYIVVRMWQILEKHLDMVTELYPASRQFNRNWWINRILDSDKFLDSAL